jgi:acyl-CoA thioester hydrolase
MQASILTFPDPSSRFPRATTAGGRICARVAGSDAPLSVTRRGERQVRRLQQELVAQFRGRGERPYFGDYPQLQGYYLPEWSRIAASDAVRFTAALVPIVEREFKASRKEVFLGEHVTVNIESVGYKHDGSRWHMRHTFRRNGTVVAIHDVKGAWLDVAARRIAAPPAGLMEAATNLPRTSDYAEIISPAK